jgi:DNA-binding XRE family transcriptional regulator
MKMLDVEKKNEKVAVCFRIPVDKLEDIKRIVAALGGDEESSTEDNWRDDFSENHPGVVLRGLRYRDGLKQSELAEKIGINQSHISEMENGKRPIGKTTARKLAKVFKTSYKLFL